MSNFVRIYVNDLNLADLGARFGFTVFAENIVGAHGGFQTKYPSAPLPGRMGSVLTADQKMVDPTTLTLALRVNTGSFAAISPAIERLRAWLAQGEVSLRTDYAPTRQAIGRDPAFVTNLDQAAVGRAALEVNYSLTNPIWRERFPTTVSVAAAGVRAPIVIGTAPSTLTARIRGPATNPVFIYRDARGVAIATLAFTITLGASDYLDIDCGEITVVLVSLGSASTVADGLALVVPGSRYPAVDSDDADVFGAAPTVEVDDDGHTATAIVSYTKGFR